MSDSFLNLLTPPILFFLLGVVATLVRSDLELPAPLPKVLSLYLLFAIGFKGGVELGHSGLGGRVWIDLGAGVLLAVVVPLYAFFILRTRLDARNAAAVAATYGSISAVTFVTAVSFLRTEGVPFDGHMVAAMALMESPAIVVGVLFARFYGRGSGAPGAPLAWKSVVHDAFLNGSVFLLVGSLLIGALAGSKGAEMLHPLTNTLFPGVLALFLLDMGIISARRFGQLRKAGPFLVGFGLLLPLVNAALGLGLALALGMSAGNGLLLMVLAASASYIAVPAAMRLAVPEADPGIYVTLSLALTFPFNILVGLPLYQAAAQHFLV